MCSIKLRHEAVVRLGARSDAVCAVGNAGGRQLRAAPAAGWFTCPARLAGDGIATHPNYLLHEAALQFRPQAQERCYRLLGIVT